MYQWRSNARMRLCACAGMNLSFCFCCCCIYFNQIFIYNIKFYCILFLKQALKFHSKSFDRTCIERFQKNCITQYYKPSHLYLPSLHRSATYLIYKILFCTSYFFSPRFFFQQGLNWNPVVKHSFYHLKPGEKSMTKLVWHDSSTDSNPYHAMG